MFIRRNNRHVKDTKMRQRKCPVKITWTCSAVCEVMWVYEAIDEAMYTSWVWSIASRTQSRRRRHCRRSHSSPFNPSFLPIPAIVGYKPVSGGLACRATPRRDETNWEIMPLNAAGRPDPITLVFSNTSPARRPFVVILFHLPSLATASRPPRFNYSNNINCERAMTEWVRAYMSSSIAASVIGQAGLYAYDSHSHRRTWTFPFTAEMQRRWGM